MVRLDWCTSNVRVESRAAPDWGDAERSIADYYCTKILVHTVASTGFVAWRIRASVGTQLHLKWLRIAARPVPKCSGPVPHCLYPRVFQVILIYDYNEVRLCA